MKAAFVALAFSVLMSTCSAIAPVTAATFKGPIGWHEMCQRDDGNRALALCEPTRKEILELTSSAGRILTSVNATVNKDYAAREDIDIYGKSEFWTAPEVPMADCEDYVLEKMLRLVEAGVPRGALKIVVVRIRSTGQAHAFLAVDTTGGALVLDNLWPDIRPLSQGFNLLTGIDVLMTQSDEDPKLWIRND